MARALTTQPLVRAGLASGTLSYSKVRAITRGCAAGGDEEALVAMAQRCTAAEVERTVRALRCAPSADLDVANRAHARRYVDWWWEPDGSLSVHGRLTSDDAAAVVEAIETAAEELHPPIGPASSGVPASTADEPLPPDPFARPPLGARRADALAEIARSGAPRVQLVLHADRTALACAEEDGGRVGDVCALDDGPAVPSETARRLTCDADIVGDHGRRRRVVSPALRSSLERRDRGCRFPGCSRRHGTHAHHIQHWAQGGATDRANLVLLCRFHHRMVHEEGFAISGSDGDVHFVHPDGHVIDPVPPRTIPRPPEIGRSGLLRLETARQIAIDDAMQPTINDAVAMVA